MRNCRGIVFGQFSQVPENDPDFDEPLNVTIQTVFKDLKFHWLLVFISWTRSSKPAFVVGKKMQLDVNPKHSQLKELTTHKLGICSWFS